jgi:hypothetical protein
MEDQDELLHLRHSCYIFTCVIFLKHADAASYSIACFAAKRINTAVSVTGHRESAIACFGKHADSTVKATQKHLAGRPKL